MGSNRKKKLGVQSIPTKAISTATTTSTKPDELAVSSMSSDSSSELLLGTATTEFVGKSSATTIATVPMSRNNTTNKATTRKNEVETLWECTNETEYVNSSSNGPQQTSFRFSWNEILALCFILVSFALCSIIVGVAAGLSISIHYYESPENLDRRRISSNENKHNVPYTLGENHRVITQKVTSVDPMVFSYSNNNYPMNVERVLHTDSATGMKVALNVVVESPALNSTDAQFTQHHQSNSTHNPNHMDDNYKYNEDMIMSPPRYSTHDNPDTWLFHPPKLCSHDSVTMGYDSYTSLRNALNDLNRYSAQQSDRWILYFANLDMVQRRAALMQSFDHNGASHSKSDYSALHSYTHSSIPVFDDDNLYYQEQFVFTICPNAILKADAYPLLIDTENIRLQCDGCTITGGNSHISFGTAARNAVVRGITFQNSKRSSLLFHQNGAEATFEDCIWVVNNFENDKRHRHIMPGLNEISNVNSSSILRLYRCSTKQRTMLRFSPWIWWRKITENV